MKILYWALSLLFALFAVVQYNDPDPILWMLLYGGIAVHYAMAALRRPYRPALLLWFAGAIVWGAFLTSDFTNWLCLGMPSIVDTMKAETPWVELTREFFGLLISAFACGWLLRRTHQASA